MLYDDTKTNKVTRTYTHIHSIQFLAVRLKDIKCSWKRNGMEWNGMEWNKRKKGEDLKRVLY